jgi:hypothetical protein
MFAQAAHILNYNNTEWVLFFKNSLLRVLNAHAAQSPIPGFADEARKNIASPGRVNQVPQKVR